MSEESRVQKCVVDWWALVCRSYRLDARLLCHVPNGGKRRKVEAAIFKGMGVRAGWPDLQLLVARGNKHALLIEMKAPSGRMTPEQRELLPIIEAQGYGVVVAWSFEEAIGAITNYLKTGDPLRKS